MSWRMAKMRVQVIKLVHQTIAATLSGHQSEKYYGPTPATFADDLVPFVESERTAALDLAAQHVPTVKTDQTEAWLVCSCGWQSGKGKSWKEQWGNHIRSL